MSLSTNFNTANNQIDDLSFGILRTNPKLSTNIKLVVNSSGSLYMDSIDANAILANASFKKFPINPSGSYSIDIARFYKDLPLNLRYDILKKNSDLSVFSEYSKQFEDQYNYGASFNSTKLYDEQYKFLAPIWLDKKVPSHFVIYRVDATDYSTLLDDSLASQNNRIMQLLNKATIVKTFDMTDNSKLGKYITSHVNDAAFPVAPIIQNFDAASHTTYCGIDVVKGGFVQKREYTNRDLLVDKIEILNNQIITDGFERNQLAVANLINIEFLFDDDHATDYKVYRYFGLYTDAIYEGEFKVNDVVNNDADQSVIIENGGVLSYYDLPVGISHQDMFLNTKDLSHPTLNWIRSPYNNFFHVKNGVSFDNTKNIPVSLENKTISEFKDDVLAGTLKINILSKEAKDFIKFKLIDTPHHGDKIYLTAISEFKADDFNLTSFTYMADNSLQVGKFEQNRYSLSGDLKHVLHALASCITHSDNPFVATVVADTIVIEDYAQGYDRNSVAFGIRTGNISEFIQVISGKLSNINNSILPVGSLTNFNDWTNYSMTGGKDENRFIYLEKQQLGNLKVGHIIKDPVLNTKSEVLEILEDAFDSDFYRICLSKKINKLNTYTNLNYYQSPVTYYGKFSAYNLKDFDFDFYDTSNSNYGELALDDLIVASSVNGTYYRYYDLACSSSFLIGHEEYYPSLVSLTEADIVNRLEDVGDKFNVDSNIAIKDLKIYSEYDRLYENELKETSLLSRVVPHINKFALKDSFNARMNPYLFTVSEAFGSDNMSPNVESGLERNALDYNMEYFHINQIPTIFKYDSANFSKLKSYVNFLNDGELTIQNLKSTTNDYFSKYFVWEGAYLDFSKVTNISYANGATYITFDKAIDESIVTNTGVTKKNGVFVPLTLPFLNNDKTVLTCLGTIPTQDGMSSIVVGDLFQINNDGVQFIKNKLKKLYTKFNKGDAYSFSDTIFRGLKYIYKSRKENVKNIPTEYVNDNLANDYKFAILVNLDKETNDTNTIIDVIKNDKFKFICVYVNISLQNNNVKEISHKILYELRHSYIGSAISDSKIDGALNIYGAYANIQNLTATTEVIIDGIDDINGKSPIFEKQISITEKGAYSYLLFDYNGNTYAFQISKVLSDTSISVIGYPKLWDSVTDTVGADAPNIIEITPSDQSNLIYTYYGGGWDAFKQNLDDIKAKSFKEIFNNFTKNVNYVNVSETGDVINNSFVLEIENGTPFYKDSYIKAAVDEDKPKSYKISSAEVGKKIVQTENPYRTILRRMNGYYVPLTKDVLYFTDIYSENKALKDGSIPTRELLIYNKFNRTGIAFSSYFDTLGLTDYGIIKNYFYHKVNTEAPDSTLKLSSGTDKLPLYPKIGEIAINKKDLNILQSKYSENYYIKSGANNEYSFVSGTVNPIEEKAFMASTIMKVSNTYDISSFSEIRLNSIDELNQYRENNKNTYSLAWAEVDDKIYADFYVKKAVLDELLERGIKSSFDSYVTPSKSYGDLTTTLDDLQLYSEQNIVPRFIIHSINIYAKEGKNINTTFVNQIDPSLIDIDIHKKQTNYSIEGFVQERLNFRLIYNKKPSYNYEFKVVVKIIA